MLCGSGCVFRSQDTVAVPRGVHRVLSGGRGAGRPLGAAPGPHQSWGSNSGFPGVPHPLSFSTTPKPQGLTAPGWDVVPRGETVTVSLSPRLCGGDPLSWGLGSSSFTQRAGGVGTGWQSSPCLPSSLSHAPTRSHRCPAPSLASLGGSTFYECLGLVDRREGWGPSGLRPTEEIVVSFFSFSLPPSCMGRGGWAAQSSLCGALLQRVTENVLRTGLCALISASMAALCRIAIIGRRGGTK